MENNKEKSLMGQLTERVMGRAGGIGGEAVEFTEAGADLRIEAAVLERMHQAFSYEEIGSMGGLLASPFIQYPDMTREGTDKILGAVGGVGARRLALASLAWPESGDDAVEVAALEDCSSDRALGDLASELVHVKTCRGDVRLMDVEGLDDVLSGLVDKGLVAEASAEALASALAFEPIMGADDVLAKENAALRRELDEVRRAQKEAADRIDMAVPDPADAYGADSERTGMLPRVAEETAEERARREALEGIEAEIEEIGVLASPAEVEESNESWRETEEGSSRRELDALLDEENMKKLVSCLRRAVSLGREQGTGSLTGASCEVALPVRAGCYLSYKEGAEPPVRTLKVFPSAAGTTAFDAQAFNSISCGYEHLVGRPEAGDPGLPALKTIDAEVFSQAPGAGYEEPPAWRTAFDRAQMAYSPEEGVLLACMRTENDPTGEAGDRFVVVSVGATPDQVSAAAEEGMSVAAALDDGKIGRATMFCNLTRNGGVEGLEPDIARIGALVGRDRGAGWAVGDDEAVVTAARNAIQRRKAQEAVAEREAEPEKETRGVVFGVFGGR